MNKVEDLQKEYDGAIADQKLIEESHNNYIKELKDRAKKRGYYLNNDGEFKKCEDAYIVLYDMAYYSYFSGEVSCAMYNTFCYAGEVSKKEFNEFVDGIKKKKPNSTVESFSNNNQEFDFFYSVFDYGKMVNNSTFYYKHKGDNNCGELDNSSKMVIAKCKKSVIVEIHYEENSVGEFDFGDSKESCRVRDMIERFAGE